jgi:signal peptidase II
LKNKSLLAIGLVFGVLLIDQIIKIYVKTHFFIGESISILGFERARIHFVENAGMAFGMEFGGDYGKLALSLFRIVAIGFLTYYIRTLIKDNYSNGLIASFSLILAGAFGNIIDSAFYGMIFSSSMPEFHGGEVAQLFPAEGGYAAFLHGKVVDMFYFPLLDGVWPAWIPYLGNTTYQFFQPVFNFADAAITVGVASLLIFQRKYFSDGEEKVTQEVANVETEAVSNL